MEAMKPIDVRCNLEIFRKAKKNEISGLSERCTWKIVDKKDVHRNANIICARLAKVLENAHTTNEIPKARYVAQECNDKMKPFVVHNNPTLRQCS